MVVIGRLGLSDKDAVVIEPIEYVQVEGLLEYNLSRSYRIGDIGQD